MTTSIIRNNKKRTIKLWSVLLWLIVWQIVAMKINQEILLVSPFSVVKKIRQLCFEYDFWKTILFSFYRIAGGFLLACVMGIITSALACKIHIIRDIFAVPVAVIKSTPVASFTILALIWITSANLSVLISFLMVYPIVYTNMLSGFESIDNDLKEMAYVFRIPLIKRFRYIYLSQIVPFLRSALLVGAGMCWKAGVAAEVIGLPNGSIGEKLYESKIYLNAPELYAWTVVIIIISVLSEKLLMFIFDMIVRFSKRV